MNRGTKITVFIASMALTVGSLVAFVGPRHCGHHGIYRHGACGQYNNYHGSCESWNNNVGADSTRIN